MTTEQVEAAVRNLDVPWMLMQDNEAGAGWDWIVVVPGGENIVGLSEVVARRIATDHSASFTAASATASPASERMARAIEALLPEIEEAEIGHGGGSHDDECPTCAAIKEAGAALAAYRSARAPEPMAGAVEGWKLVPVEPTEEMLKAGGRAMSGTSPSWYLNNPGNVWPAMLSAAPAPPIAQASAPVPDGAASDLVERLIEWADAAGLSGRDTLACDLVEAAARIERLEAALRRLGSMEGFTAARMIVHPQDDELIARVEHARTALGD